MINMDQTRKTLTRLDLTIGGQQCFLLTTLIDEGKEGFELTVCNGKQAWNGEVTADDLDDHRVKVKMDFNTYVLQTARAFTGEKEGDIIFQFQLKNKKDNSVEFVWKKHVPAEDITFQLGSTILQPVGDTGDTICTILNHCIDNTAQLNKNIRTLEMDNERLSQERSNALKRLEKCVAAKEDIEKDLYTKFVTILNSKKEKICELKEQLSNGVSSSIQEQDKVEPKSGTSQQRSNQSKQRKRNKQNDANSDGESGNLTPSDDDTTDEESRPSQSKRVRIKAENLADDSLVLEEEDEASGSRGKTTLVTRPQRQRGGKKQTPSKPVLPKVSSKESDSGHRPGSSSSSSKRSSVRKSASSISNRSSDNIDADDLIDEI